MIRLAALVLLTLLPEPLAAQQARNAKLVARIDSIARKALTDGRIPGLSIGVSRNRETIVARGYGYARLDDSTRATAETVYPIASIAKQFTAAAIMQLDEANKVGLRDSIQKYVPAFPGQGRKTTVQQLLNHTAGIPNDAAPDSSGRRPSALEHTPGAFPAAFGPLPREFPPGEKFAYSNAGYYLLGLVIEAASGESYASYVREHLFKPVAMTSSSDCGEAQPGLAQGYDRVDSVVVPVPALPAGRFYAAAGLCSTVLDLLKWPRALFDGKVVNFFSWKQMTEPAELKDGSRAGYGYGMTLGRLGKHRSTGHGGSVPGFSSQLMFYPDDQVTVVVLANSERAVTRRIADQVAGAVLGIIEPKVKDLPIPAADLDRYTGTFDLAGEDLGVFIQGGSLMMRIGANDGIRLLYQGANEFAAEPDPVTRLYFRVSQGRARSVLFSAGDLSLTADRK